MKTKVKKIIIVFLTLTTAFSMGFTFKSILSERADALPKMKKVTGIGGIFFKCKDPGKMRDWYNTHLGLNTDEYGTNFEWRQASDSTKKGFTQWSPFNDSTKYFGPSTQDFMIAEFKSQMQLFGLTNL